MSQIAAAWRPGKKRRLKCLSFSSSSFHFRIFFFSALSIWIGCPIDGFSTFRYIRKKKEFEIPSFFSPKTTCAFVVSPETRRKCQHESTSVRARSAAFNHDTWNLNEKSFPLLYMFLIDISNICMFSFSIDAFVVCCYPPRGISNNKLHYQAVKVSVVL
jgi:hypothetical protein